MENETFNMVTFVISMVLLSVVLVQAILRY